MARRVDVTTGSPDGADERVGTVVAARSFAEDVSGLVRAEIALARAELQEAARAKMLGAGLIGAAGALAAVALLGLPLALGFVLSEVAGLPGWASALIVSGVLLVGAAVLALAGRAKLREDVGLETTKRTVQEDVTWARERLKSPATNERR